MIRIEIDDGLPGRAHGALAKAGYCGVTVLGGGGELVIVTMAGLAGGTRHR